MVTKYIERDKAVKLIFLAADTGHTAKALSLLGKESVADIAPVVHARWIDDDCAFMRCSLCGYENDWEWATPYCPQCGARMDGGDSDEP